MRGLLWVVAFFVGMVGVVLPISYFYFASQLPPLESEFDLERQMRGYIEGERTSNRVGSVEEEKLSSTWKRPDYADLPRDLVALYISSLRCPTFFQTPREATLQADWRAFNNWVLGRGIPGVNGRCELLMGSHLTTAIRIYTGLPAGIAALKIRTMLTKDQLVAYDLFSIRFDNGVFGMADASRQLFHKRLTELTLAQQAELALTFSGEWEELKSCKGPIILKQDRDALLEQLAADSLVPADRAKRAEEDPISCLKD